MHSKKEKYCADTPYLMNCLKHHMGFIKSRINFYSNSELLSMDELISELNIAGNSRIDIYTGNLGVREITGEISCFLNNLCINEEAEYARWLGMHHKNFAQVILSDQSNWTLLLGDEKERYVHIHPSRHSPLSVRYKAATLKTAIVYLIFGKLDYIKGIELDAINKIRKEYLKLAPIKSINSSPGIKDLIITLSRFNEIS